MLISMDEVPATFGESENSSLPASLLVMVIFVLAGDGPKKMRLVVSRFWPTVTIGTVGATSTMVTGIWLAGLGLPLGVRNPAGVPAVMVVLPMVEPAWNVVFALMSPPTIVTEGGVNVPLAGSERESDTATDK